MIQPKTVHLLLNLNTSICQLKGIRVNLLSYISKLFMPPDSADRSLTVPIRAVRSFRKHLYLISCQEPVRRPLRLYGLHGPLGSLGSLGPLGFLGPLRPLGPLGPLGQSG